MVSHPVARPLLSQCLGYKHVSPCLSYLTIKSLSFSTVECKFFIACIRVPLENTLLGQCCFGVLVLVGFSSLLLHFHKRFKWPFQAPSPVCQAVLGTCFCYIVILRNCLLTGSSLYVPEDLIKKKASLASFRVQGIRI